MKPWIRTAAAAVIGASALAAGPAFAADVPAQPAASTKATSQLKIGVVNMERILRESKTAQCASDRLNEEGQRRQEEIEAMSRRFKTKLERFEKDAASMSEAERVNERRELAEMERDVTRRSREAREEFNQRRNEEVLLLQNRAARIIQDVSRREHFDLVLYEFFYASDRIDLTKRVIDELDRSTLNDGKKK